MTREEFRNQYPDYADMCEPMPEELTQEMVSLLLLQAGLRKGLETFNSEPKSKQGRQR